MVPPTTHIHSFSTVVQEKVKYKYKFSPGMTYTYISTISFLKGTIHNQALCTTEAVVERHVVRG
jgi:hypothetical protein